MSGFYKLANNSDKTKALVCHSENGDGGSCIFYDIIENSFSEDFNYFKKCKNAPKSIHVDFFERTKEFIFTCCNNGMGLSIMKFDSDGILLEKILF